MDFQTDFLGLDNVSTYYNATQAPSRRRESTMSTTSTASSTSASTYTRTYTPSRKASMQAYTPPPTTASKQPRSHQHTYPHHRSSFADTDLSTSIDAGAAAAFSALRLHPSPPRRTSPSPRQTSPSSTSPTSPRRTSSAQQATAVIGAETGSQSSTSSPIAIPARPASKSTASGYQRRRRVELQAGVVDMRRAMDMAGFGAYMNS